MTASQKTFLVCHGAWSAGWAWKKMHPLMQKAGHRLVTPTYTGLGERAPFDVFALAIEREHKLEHHQHDDRQGKSCADQDVRTWSSRQNSLARRRSLGGPSGRCNREPGSIQIVTNHIEAKVGTIASSQVISCAFMSVLLTLV